MIRHIIFLQYWGKISSEVWPEELYEFWDPDTVELMEWIRTYTPPNAVFAGSMQLLAGVKLCTGRHITNHPHYEDSWLRHRTHEVSSNPGFYSRNIQHLVSFSCYFSLWHTMYKVYGGSFALAALCIMESLKDLCRI